MIPALTALAVVLAPTPAFAHAIDERYDLPAPLAYFVAGAAATVALSIVVAALFARRAPSTVGSTEEFAMWIPGAPLAALRGACRVFGVSMLAIAMVAALWGTGNPMMNFAPTLVWIIWWVGGSLAVACIGNVWPAFDPWRTLFDWIDALARRLFGREGVVLNWAWPASLGAWPAVALLLAWAGLEVVYPLAAVPYRLGYAALAWTAVSIAGMVCFGPETWQRNGDVFAVYFATLGRFAPLAVVAGENRLLVSAPGSGLVATEPASAAMVGLTLAMLSTVLFDGLLSGPYWAWFEQTLNRAMPQFLDRDGYVAGTIGLIGVWIAFIFAYWLTCAVTAPLVRGASAAMLARRFAFTLVPIAVAYNVAHNFSSLLIQGQNAIALFSDPLGLGWNLFGTAHRHPDIGVVDARLTWYVAIGAIVTGHVIAVWLAHRVALREWGSTRRSIAASIPLTALMVAYTAISLSVIAEPMVRFDPPPAEQSGPSGK